MRMSKSRLKINLSALKKNRGDRWLFFLPLALCTFGLLMIFNASSLIALQVFEDKFHFLKHQAIWMAIGFGAFIFMSHFDYRKLRALAFPGLLASLFLLFVVLIPGIGQEIYGGRRWLNLGFFGFQPAELAKLSLVIYLATLFEKRRELLPFLALTGLVLILILLEPDLGTATLLGATAFCLYFLAGAPMKEILMIGGAGAVVGPLLILLSPYRKKRLLTFLNSSFDPDGASYHVRQILIALGSGGIFGRGLGHSRQKFLFLPEVTTDSIFAIMAEEFGFLGSAALLFAFGFLLYRGIGVALRAKDKFGQLLVGGIVFYIGLQAIVNLGAMVALLPLTGVPLPFISYGGSSLLITLTGLGIVYNVSRNN